jgi:hypothetical protein
MNKERDILDDEINDGTELKEISKPPALELSPSPQRPCSSSWPRRLHLSPRPCQNRRLSLSATRDP